MRCLPALALLLLAPMLPAQRGGGGMHGGGGGMRPGGFPGGGMRGGGMRPGSFSGSGMRGGGMRPGGFPGGGMRGGGMRPGGFSGGGMRSGGSARSTSTFQGGVSTFRGASNSPRVGNRYAGNRPTFRDHDRNYGNRFYDNDHHGDNHRGNTYRGYNNGYPVFLNYGYGYPLYNSIFDNDADLFWGDYNPNLTADNGRYPEQSNDQQTYELAPPQAYEQQAWQPPYAATPPAPAPPTAAAAPEETTTLVFKDGRPPEQIRNYALSRTAIYITGSRIRVIPLDELDLAATIHMNQDSGTPFRLP